MNHISFIFISFSLIILILIIGYLIRAIYAIRRQKSEELNKDKSEVGFVVNTFHDLVSRLKEKERELEVLRTRAEERASEIEIYNEDILQSVPSGVISFDRDLRITKINTAAEKILDLEPSGIIGKTPAEVFTGPLPAYIAGQEMIERTESGYTTVSGRRIWLGLNLSPLKDSSGDVIGKILIFTDLTELKAFQSQMELRERLSNLGEMSAGIAHELRNPMAVISGYTKLLAKKLDPAQLSAVEAITREIAVMDRIITDFLSFARPSEPVISEVDLDKLISESIGSVEELTERISVSISGDPGIRIRADEVLLRQAVTNLLHNAVQAMPDGGALEISVSCPDELILKISDTGHGIPESIREKIFLPFFTTKERGTGLGLSIIHKVVVSHGGTIEVASGGFGTTFTIRLPGKSVVKRGGGA